MQSARFSYLALLLWIGVSAAQADAPARYTITDLGTLPGGRYSAATALNNKGQVAGWADTGATEGVLTAHAFLWDAGKMTDIDTLPGYHQQAPGTVARAINDQGEVVGGVEPILLLSQSPQILGYLYQGVGWIWRQGKTQAIGGDALGINSHGQVLLQDNKRLNVIWHGGRTEPVPLVPGYASLTATCLNNKGDVAGYCGNGPGEAKGFVRLHGKVWLLGSLPGQNTSRARAVNDSGQVIGESSSESYETDSKGGVTMGENGQSAFLWQNGRLTDFGDRDLSGLGSRGQVLGSEYHPAPGGKGTTKVFLWQNGKFTDLSTLIPAGSGWTLEDANAINDRGQIAGVGEHDGQERAFLMTPVPQ